MAGSSQVNFLAQALGNELVAAHAQAKDKPVEIGNAGLPEGIEGGIARLDKMSFGVYKEGKNTGKPFFMATGVVLFPTHHSGIPIAGLQTKIGPIPLCATPQAKGKRKTFNDNYTHFLNELKKFGVDSSQSSATTPQQVEAYLQASLAELNRLKPTFRFRTWKGEATKDFPNPGINHEWNGACEFDPAKAEAGPGVHNDTPLAPPPPATAFGAPAAPPAAQALAPQPAPSAPVQPPAPAAPVAPSAPEPDPSVDLETWAAIADADPNGTTEDGKAANKAMTSAAMAAGISAQTISDAPNWATVLAMMAPAAAAAPVAAAPSGPPVVGGIYSYQLRDANGQPFADKPALQIEIMTVNEAAQTATAKTIDGKLVIGADRRPAQIKWAYLE